MTFSALTLGQMRIAYLQKLLQKAVCTGIIQKEGHLCVSVGTARMFAELIPNECSLAGNSGSLANGEIRASRMCCFSSLCLLSGASFLGHLTLATLRNTGSLPEREEATCL